MARRGGDLGRALRLLVVAAIVVLAGSLAYSFWQKQRGGEAHPLSLADTTTQQRSNSSNAQQAIAQASLEALNERDDMIEKQAVEIEGLNARVEALVVENSELQGEVQQLTEKLEETGNTTDSLELALDTTRTELDVTRELLASIEPAAGPATSSISNDAEADVSVIQEQDATEQTASLVEPLQEDVAEDALAAETIADDVTDAETVIEEAGIEEDAIEEAAVEEAAIEEAIASIELSPEAPDQTLNVTVVGTSDAPNGLNLADRFAGLVPDPSVVTAGDGAEAYRSGNYELAGAIWYQLARTGNPRSQFHLGGMLAEGRLDDPDPVGGYVWLQRAANGGYEPATALMAAIENQIDPSVLEQLKNQ